MPTRFLALAAVWLILAVPPVFADDDDRMAGSVPHAASSDRTEESVPVAAEGDRTAGAKPADAPEPAHKEIEEGPEAAPGDRVEVHISGGSMPANFTRIESAGLLSNPREGSLGIDMWDGSARPFVASLVPEIPPAGEYRTLHNLVRRALLTRADTALLDEQRNMEPGQDLLTLRIEKLTEMGDFTQAIQLYTQSPGDPYHERLARAGILAMIYDGQASLACLETKALGDKFSNALFWQQMSGLCDYLLAKIGGGGSALPGPRLLPDSQVIRQAAAADRFRYAVKSVDDLSILTPLETAVLIADGRIDYSDLKKLDLGSLAPVTLALLLRDKKIPDDIRFRLMTEAVRLGLKSTDDLGSFYIDAGLSKKGKQPSSYNDVSGWRRLAWLYRTLRKPEGRDVSESEILQEALSMEKKYGITALFPFAPFLADADVVSFDNESVRTGLYLLILSGLQPPKGWTARWAEVRQNDIQDRLLQVAVHISTGFSTEKSPSPEDIEKLAKDLPEAQSQLIKMLYKKLDKSTKLHNDAGVGVYEKLPDLTSDDSYVMPSIGLMDSLNKALTDRRLGEVVLLSSIALHGAAPDKIYAGLLREVLDGFETVGLTKEARDLSKEIVLGLSR